LNNSKIKTQKKFFPEKLQTCLKLVRN